jgi:hypothetical protein
VGSTKESCLVNYLVFRVFKKTLNMFILEKASALFLLYREVDFLDIKKNFKNREVAANHLQQRGWPHRQYTKENS